MNLRDEKSFVVPLFFCSSSWMNFVHQSYLSALQRLFLTKQGNNSMMIIYLVEGGQCSGHTWAPLSSQIYYCVHSSCQYTLLACLLACALCKCFLCYKWMPTPRSSLSFFFLVSPPSAARGYYTVVVAQQWARNRRTLHCRPLADRFIFKRARQ